IELFLRDLREWSVGIDHGVCNNAIEAAVSGLHVLEQRVHRGWAPRVRPDAGGFGSNCRDSFIEPAVVTSRHDDGGALFHERLRDREPDSLRAASDNSDFPIE